MATIKFLLQSKNNPANIYVRVTDGRKVDVKTKTKYIIDPADWSDSKQRPKNLKNIDLKNLDFDLQTLRVNLLNYYNNSDAEKNLIWLKNFLNPVFVKEIPKDLVGYFDYYLEERENEINHRTYMKIKVVQNKIIKFQKEKKITYLLKDVNAKFKKDFEEYSNKHGYSFNTIMSNIKEIKGICYHAEKKGILISSELAEMKVGQKKAESIYLTFDELEKIEKTVLKIKELQDARDWLIISCYTGQRVSDFMRFNKEMIREQGKVKLIEFTQQKTTKTMTLPLHPKVLEILAKRNGNFPDATNDVKYNIAIKNVCKKAKLNQVVYGGKNDAVLKRKVFKDYPKHELVTSHIGRRSFATNFYGKIPTSLLISATGHSTEQMFLVYIGKSNSDKALELANYF